MFFLKKKESFVVQCLLEQPSPENYNAENFQPFVCFKVL